MTDKENIYIYVQFILLSFALVHIQPTISHEYALCNLYLKSNQMSLTIFLLCHIWYQLHQHNALKWIPKKDLGFM